MVFRYHFEFLMGNAVSPVDGDANANAAAYEVVNVCYRIGDRSNQIVMVLCNYLICVHRPIGHKWHICSLNSAH